MKSKKLALPYILWMFVFTLVPLVLVISYAIRDENGNFTLEFLAKAMKYGDVFFYSLWVAALSTVICLLLAYPISYIISRSKERTQRTLTMLIMVPMWMNFLLRIYAWVILLQTNGPVASLFSLFGIKLQLIGNTGAVVLGMVYEYLPFMILPLYTVMGKIDNSLIEAAQDLGSNKFNVIRKVVFPLTVPGIISGVTMVFVPATSTFLVSQYLGGTDNIMIGDVIEKVFWTDKNTGSAIALCLMVVILLCIIVMNRFGDEEAVGI
ncbi:MAG: ABC transporter permease [Clostridia bacterium]|nr:ABC transporter permease [Clostridia bacterium]